MKKTLPLLLSILIISCNNPMKKSIFKELTVDELKSSIEDDSLFAETYKLIKFKKDSILTLEIERVKWSDLTYKRIEDFVKYTRDTTILKPLRKIFKQRWNKKYRAIKEEVDSVSNYWKNYAKNKSPGQYVKVELVTLDKEYYSYIDGIKSVNLGFKLTPLKGKIDQMRFGYKLEPKIDENDKEPEYLSILSELDYSWCIMSRPFSRPTTAYWESSYDNEEILESRSVKTLLRDYNIDIIIDEIRINGENIDRNELGIPECIKNYWDYENTEYLSDLYIDDVAKELLGKKYVSDYEFIAQKFDSVYKVKDKLSYEFLTLKKDK